ncbi:MAG: helix-turn-helix transcriptional regulator [Polycyclovorans sp.]|nr:helix-turn-helix transcriptional regulator [Polycyclovorans sp.]
MKPIRPPIAPVPRRHAKRGTDTDLLALCDTVRAARTAAGMTQAELALVCGVSRDTVIAFENGRSGVSLGVALRVMRGLGLTLSPAIRR